MYIQILLYTITLFSLRLLLRKFIFIAYICDILSATVVYIHWITFNSASPYFPCLPLQFKWFHENILSFFCITIKLYLLVKCECTGACYRLRRSELDQTYAHTTHTYTLHNIMFFFEFITKGTSKTLRVMCLCVDECIVTVWYSEDYVWCGDEMLLIWMDPFLISIHLLLPFLNVLCVCVCVLTNVLCASVYDETLLTFQLFSPDNILFDC